MMRLCLALSLPSLEDSRGRLVVLEYWDLCLLKFHHHRQFKYFENGNRLFLLKYPSRRSWNYCSTFARLTFWSCNLYIINDVVSLTYTYKKSDRESILSLYLPGSFWGVKCGIGTGEDDDVLKVIFLLQ